MKSGAKGEYQKILQSATLFSSDAHFFFLQKITEVLYERIKLQDLRRAAAVPQCAKTLGIAPSSAYELMHEKDFPTLHINCRMVVPKEKFIAWVEMKTEVSK